MTAVIFVSLSLTIHNTRLFSFPDRYFRLSQAYIPDCYYNNILARIDLYVRFWGLIPLYLSILSLL